MSIRAEVLGHAALSVDTAPEGYRLQVAAQVIAPGVINAVEIRCASAGVIQADQGATMRAAIFERRDGTVLIARDHDRHLPDKGGTPVAGGGDFGFEA